MGIAGEAMQSLLHHLPEAEVHAVLVALGGDVGGAVVDTPVMTGSLEE